jgi:hypothetical protein
MKCPECGAPTWSATVGIRDAWNYRTYRECYKCGWDNDPGVSQQEILTTLERAGCIQREIRSPADKDRERDLDDNLMP